MPEKFEELGERIGGAGDKFFIVPVVERERFCSRADVAKWRERALFSIALSKLNVSVV